MIKVSVIVPVYNTADYLAEALDSVLSQTLKELELICIDDGSTDESSSILDKYACIDSRVFVEHITNGGQGRARNIGLELARGQYVYFLDSDDYLIPTALEDLYQISLRDNLDMLYGEGRIVAEDGDKHNQAQYVRTSLYPEVYSGAELYESMVENEDYFTTPCMCLARKKFLCEKEISFPEGYIHEDEAFSMLALALAERAGVVPNQHYVRRYRAGSTMTALSHKKSILGYLSSWRFIKANPYITKPAYVNSYAESQVRLSKCIWRTIALSSYALKDAKAFAYSNGFAQEFDDLIGETKLSNALKLRALRAKYVLKRLLGRG